MKETTYTMTKAVKKLLDEQIYRELQASDTYLDMAIWADDNDYKSTARFFYAQSEEERTHMMKIIRYLIESQAPPLYAPKGHDAKGDYPSVKELFRRFLQNEMALSRHIHHLVALTLEEKDFRTFNFLQWFVAEQREEENRAHTILGYFEAAEKGGLPLYAVEENIKALCE